MDSVLNFSAISLPTASYNHHHPQNYVHKASAIGVIRRKCNGVSSIGCASSSSSTSAVYSFMFIFKE
uniref:Uncharacterized protein n=1 Tax=Kalanchoe fedtschenkoi TaxID=63787 RepID=A0A7N0V857_KALFE